MPRNARFAALLLAVTAMATAARAADLPAFGTTAAPSWNTTTLFQSSLSSGSSLALGLPPLSPDIDFSSGRELAVAGMSERDVFFKSYLTPRLNSRLGGMRAAVAQFADPNANPWTRTWETQDQVRDNAMRATKSAVKRYALERLYLTGWSVPLGSGHGRGLAAFRTDSGGPRLRFGLSHRAPRVEALFPMQKGRMAVSADPLGRVGAAFETPSGRLRFGLNLDPQEHEATFGLLVSL